MFSHQGVFNAIAVIARSLTGIVGDNYNLLLKIPQQSGAKTRDPVTGNWVLGTTTTIELKAQVEFVKDPVNDPQAGLNYDRIYVVGQLVDPLAYPPSFPESINAEMLYQGRWRKGKFLPMESFSPSFDENVNIDLALGQAIKGYFEIMEGQ